MEVKYYSTIKNEYEIAVQHNFSENAKIVFHKIGSEMGLSLMEKRKSKDLDSVVALWWFKKAK